MFFHKPDPIEEIVRFAEKHKEYGFDVRRKLDDPYTFYFVNDNYSADLKIESKLTKLAKKISRKGEIYRIMGINPGNGKFLLGEYVYKKPKS